MTVKQIKGIWLPATEKHFAESPFLGDKYPILDEALKFIPKSERHLAIDVGAHIGLWSRWLVKEFKEVIAFEPCEDYSAILKQNVPASNLKIEKYALGASYGSVSIRTYPEDTGLAHIDGYGTIPMVPLDSYSIKNLSLIKIDVEGYELQVIRGATATLTKNSPIVVIEQKGHDVINFAEKRDAASEMLMDLGFHKLGHIGADYIFGKYKYD